jgi:hypothetical protein
MYSNKSRSKVPSPRATDLEAKIAYLNGIGFKSNELAGAEKTGAGFKGYFEKQIHSTVNVTELWSIPQQRQFLKTQGLFEAEKERIKRARLKNTGVTSVRERRMHDEFMDSIAYRKLPKLTVEVNKLRNKPAEGRRLETFAIFSKTHTRLERPHRQTPKHYEEKIEQLRSRYFSPQPKKDKLEGLIATCEEAMKSSIDILRTIAKRPKQLPTKVVSKRRQDERIARKVKKLMDIQFNWP